MSLRDRIFTGGVWTDSDTRIVLGTGTPLVSAAANRDGRAIADVYALAFSDVVAGTSATVTVTTNSPNNPYGIAPNNTHAVVLDGLTVHTDVIPGVSLIFSANGAFSAAWTVTVDVGEFLGTFDAFGGGAGVPSAGIRHQVYNDGTGAVSNAKARLLPPVKWAAKTGLVFYGVKPFAEGATQKTAGGGSVRVMPYVISISATAGAGAGKTCTVSVDGVAFPAASLVDLSNGATQDGTGVKAVAGGAWYRVASGLLTGVEFAIDPAVANGDVANLLVFSPQFVQIAPDVAGVAGAWGTADVVLTQTGQGAGVVQSTGVAYYWRRILVPAGGNAQSNPLPADVAITGTETEAAGWLV